MAHYKEDVSITACTSSSTHNEQPLPLNIVALIFLFKYRIFPLSHLKHQICLLDCLLLQHAFFKMENSLFTPCLDELFNPWNNGVCQMNYWVHTAVKYRSTPIIERVHKAFFNNYQFSAITNIPDEIILARMMTSLDLEFKRA